MCPKGQVEVKESGCTFRFDFAKVYWNSRLQVMRRFLIGGGMETGLSLKVRLSNKNIPLVFPVLGVPISKHSGVFSTEKNIACVFSEHTSVESILDGA